jgi:signal transduction histidine kinase
MRAGLGAALRSARVMTPSIRGRLANALLFWSLMWSIGVTLAVGLSAQHEIDELLDETLQSTASVLGQALASSGAAAASAPPVTPTQRDAEFAWQLVASDGQVLRRSANAPAVALQHAATAGFSQTADWRVHGSALPGANGAGPAQGQMLYVAHQLAERHEARLEVIVSAALAALSIGLLGHLWLRARVRQELLPLEHLSQRLETFDPLDPAQALGAAERAELVPVHDAIGQLGSRLAERVAQERRVAAHAAHALRTPLAGMDAQLAVALRESTPESQPRLQRVREASVRLQRVVRSLLELFRLGGEVQRQHVNVKALLAHLPVPDLDIAVDEQLDVDADPDLLAAALLNLLDNAQRHGAHRVSVGMPAPGRLLVRDDGPGAGLHRLTLLRAALATQTYEGQTGLGLMLADLVARAHGGYLALPDTPSGFAAELVLTADGAVA